LKDFSKFLGGTQIKGLKCKRQEYEFKVTEITNLGKRKKKQRMQTGLVTNASPYIHKGGTQKLREVACFGGEFMFKRF